MNGPSSTVVAGDADAIAEFVAAAQAEDIRARQVPVDYASHSAHVERIEAELLDVLGPITPQRPAVPFYSTVTGGLLSEPVLDATYWYRNLRNPVRFEETIRSLVAKGFTTFVESSAHPVLTMGIQETAEAAGAEVLVAGSLRRDEGGLERFLVSAAELFVRGVDIDWAALFEDTGARRVDLPTYAFQRAHYWLPAAPATEAAALAPRDSLAYRVQWKSLRTDDPAARLSGRWLLVAPGSSAAAGPAEAARQALAALGATVETLTVDPAHADRSLLRTRIAEAADRPDGTPLAGILSLLALTDGPHPEHPVLSLGLAATLALTQAAADAGTGARLWAATSGAVAVSPAETPAPEQAQLWGFGRVAALELPALWGGLVDLPARPDARAWQRLAAVLAAAPGAHARGADDPRADDQVAVRPSGTYGRRLVQAAAGGPSAPATARGTVLVIGDLTAVAAPLARRLLDAGAGRVVLAGPADGLPQVDGAPAERVTLAPCDLGSDRDLRELLVRHAPSALYVVPPPAVPTTLSATTTEGFAAAVAAKTDLATRLDALLAGAGAGAESGAGTDAGTALDAFVLFSSVAGVWGGAGQGGYAAGTAHLDALAEVLRDRGLPATSIAWTPWQGAVDGPAADRIRGAGLSFLDPERALDVLDTLVARGESGLAVADVDWERFAPAYTAARPSALLDELPAVRALRAAEREAAAARAADDTGIAASLRGRTAEEQRRELLRLVRSQVAAALGHSSPGDIAPDRAFKDLGLNSVTAVE
ncbi:type I polyketide synthase, partial [Streptomyces sp. NPDC054838]